MNKKEDVILVLGGGSARGLAHIGVIVHLEELFNIKAIIGTSMGAIIGGLYASGLSTNEILNIAKNIKPKDYLSFLKLHTSGGFVNSKKILSFFSDLVGNKKIEDLDIPYASVAFDIKSKATVILNKGNLASAMLASCSLPLIFKPFKYKNYLFCDGGVEYPLPTDLAGFFGKKLKVVAVNVLPPVSHKPVFVNIDTQKYATSKENNIMLSLHTTAYNQSFLAIRSLFDYKPDYYISAYTNKVYCWEFHKVEEFYEVGLKSAKAGITIEKPRKNIDDLNSTIRELKRKIKEMVDLNN